MAADFYSILKQLLVALALTAAAAMLFALPPVRAAAGTDGVFLAIIAVQCAAAMVSAIRGLWSRLWPLYGAMSLAMAFLLMMAGALLMEWLHESELDRAGPAGMALMLPWVVSLIANILVGGVWGLRLFIRAVRDKV